MTNTLIGRSLTTTTIIIFLLCAITKGPNAGVTWWITAYLIIYPFIHLTYRYLDNHDHP